MPSFIGNFYIFSQDEKQRGTAKETQQNHTMSEVFFGPKEE